MSKLEMHSSIIVISLLLTFCLSGIHGQQSHRSVDTELWDHIWFVHVAAENLQKGTWSKLDQVLSSLSNIHIDETMENVLFRFLASTNATIIQEFHRRLFQYFNIMVKYLASLSNISSVMGLILMFK